MAALFDLNALRVLEERYLLRNHLGEVIETPEELIWRVAKAVAKPEKKYGATSREVEIVSERFAELMSNLEFLPNSPTLMNAGTPIGQLSACFVVPIEDSIESIFSAVKNMAAIHQSGGGTGFSFSKLRPRGDCVKSTGGVASGPVSFMRVFDISTEVIKQGGRRRGANMGVLRVDHPDILEFISAKKDLKSLRNFNISVAVTEKYMKAVLADKKYSLINPRTGKKTGELSARKVFDLIAQNAWETGEPGLLFIDEINKHNPTPTLGVIESTNPCGEQPLLPYESCNLGSINLTKMLSGKEINWVKLKAAVHDAVRFLDNVIDATRFPLPEIEEKTKANRKIGLGVMGFAEMLIMMEIPYNSEKALRTAEKIMSFITAEARKKSAELGRERGSFPNFKKSVWAKKYRYMRNATITTIAPTGTLSIIAGTSSGIEPLFAIAYVRNVLNSSKLPEINKLFIETAKEKGFYSQKLMEEVALKGSLMGVSSVPEKIRKLFLTAHEITPEWHVRMQAAFQKYTDNAVSKTINLPSDATIEDVKSAFLLAHKLKCKGITVYRYNSRDEQVLNLGSVTQGCNKPSYCTI